MILPAAALGLRLFPHPNVAVRPCAWPRRRAAVLNTEPLRCRCVCASRRCCCAVCARVAVRAREARDCLVGTAIVCLNRPSRRRVVRRCSVRKRRYNNSVGFSQSRRRKPQIGWARSFHLVTDGREHERTPRGVYSHSSIRKRPRYHAQPQSPHPTPPQHHPPSRIFRRVSMSAEEDYRPANGASYKSRISNDSKLTTTTPTMAEAR
jgi:hypothetical protein